MHTFCISPSSELASFAVFYLTVIGQRECRVCLPFTCHIGNLPPRHRIAWKKVQRLTTLNIELKVSFPPTHTPTDRVPDTTGNGATSVHALRSRPTRVPLRSLSDYASIPTDSVFRLSPRAPVPLSHGVFATESRRRLRPRMQQWHTPGHRRLHDVLLPRVSRRIPTEGSHGQGGVGTKRTPLRPETGLDGGTRG